MENPSPEPAPRYRVVPGDFEEHVTPPNPLTFTVEDTQAKENEEGVAECWDSPTAQRIAGLLNSEDLRRSRAAEARAAAQRTQDQLNAWKEVALELGKDLPEGELQGRFDSAFRRISAKLTTKPAPPKPTPEATAPPA